MTALFLAAVFALLPQDLSNVASLAVMDGDCTKLVLAGSDATARCEGKLINTAYRNDRSSFMAMVGNEMMVSFYGEDHAATGDTASLTVTKVTITRIGENKPRMTDATGACNYTNPYAGPSHVECNATAGGKTYALSFVSDGKPPSVQRF